MFCKEIFLFQEVFRSQEKISSDCTRSEHGRFSCQQISVAVLILRLNVFLVHAFAMVSEKRNLNITEMKCVVAVRKYRICMSQKKKTFRGFSRRNSGFFFHLFVTNWWYKHSLILFTSGKWMWQHYRIMISYQKVKIHEYCLSL